MLGPIDDRTPPMTPQLALRVAMIGGIALLLFAIIFFRLWFLQVLSGTKYVAEAQSNRTASVSIAAPRGEIVDSSGTALVESVAVPSIQIAPRSLPGQVVLDGKLALPVVIPSKDNVVFDKLARLIHMSTKPHRCTYTVYWTYGPHTYTTQLATIPCRIAEGVAQREYANVAIKTNVPTYIQDYIEENITDYQGVLTNDTYIRKYPLGDAGAQLFGSYGPITSAEVGTKAYRGIKAGNLVGQSGLESQYNAPLQGVNGSEQIKVNAQGQFEGYGKETKAKEGDTVKLSISAPLEKVGQRSLEESIAAHGGSGGAFVAMDPKTGQIYAMGSAPSYDPSKISPSISTKEWAYLNNQANGYPLIDRAIAGLGADGSTFKVITAVAALESGRWGLDSVYDDTDCYIPPGSPSGTPCKHNSGDSAYGPTDLVKAIQDSVDTFFYNLGGLENVDVPKGGPLQTWARQFGIGSKTGVDLPGELAGTLPTPAWIAGQIKKEQECDSATGSYRYTNGTLNSATMPKGAAAKGWHRSPKHALGGCQIAIYPWEYWTVGDNVNTAVGQGDDQVTPLQLAVVYSALENGGNIVTPHIAQEIQAQDGTIVSKANAPIKRHLDIASDYLQAIQTGLYDAAHAGTSADVMGDFPEPVYGKTGTAQYGTAEQIATNTEPDYAWYACYVPATATSKPITVVVWVEKGGFGDVAAAPVARQILSQWFLGKPGPFKSGTSTDL